MLFIKFTIVVYLRSIDRSTDGLALIKPMPLQRTCATDFVG